MNLNKVTKKQLNCNENVGGNILYTHTKKSFNHWMRSNECTYGWAFEFQWIHG